ncbi:MAG: hypothetical protein HN742_32560 [Lentisphaerae bacterium]|jgi:hypothetical protein|nr:hypothetical protein [Lentisphaerota bacterium]MBT4814084.1 hypothetical protein [Lentisphaerota bacterium]MBT5608991.1 hypothetical protein [Lentisphaerota bacterium]MBT7054668.1 hypothetical protein [Lentisphaerota bacterium]MBT7846648.1 hypothetical protein [Lentisphaerota bacterium]
MSQNPMAVFLATALTLSGIGGAARAQSTAPSLASLSPKLAWIVKEKLRGGYNYNPPLEYFPIAKNCGMNAIISRLEIANQPSGDVNLVGTLKPGARKPDALISYELIEPSSKLARELGLHWFYMLNLAGSYGNYIDGIRDNPRRFNNGKLPASTDDIYWQRVVEDRFLRVARMLQGDEYQIDGFLIDPEMYALRGATPPGLDVGDFALDQFLKAKGMDLDLSGMDMDARHTWLRKHKLTADLETFQIERIETLATRTRERVQELFPDAVFGFLLWRDSLWFRAVARGFGTARTPCFVGPESTYPGGFSPEFLKYRDFVRREADAPILFVPGLSLSCDESDALMKVLPGNLYHRSATTEGYWFWALSRAFGDAAQRGRATAMLARVNSELNRRANAAGPYESSLKPAPLPAGIPAHLHDTLLSARSWTRPDASALPATMPAGRTAMGLRGLHTLVFAAEKGKRYTLRIRNVQLGRYTSPTSVSFFRPGASQIKIPDIPLHATKDVSVIADVSGMWLVSITSHNNAFTVDPADSGAVLYAPGKVAGCGGKGEGRIYRWFFYVPRHVDTFTMNYGGTGHEPATFRVFRSDGSVDFEHSDVRKSTTREVRAGDEAGQVWWLETSGIVEDYAFGFTGIPTLFASDPARLLCPTR